MANIRKLWQYPSVVEVNIFPNTVPVISGQDVIISYPKTLQYPSLSLTHLGIEYEEAVDRFSYHPDYIFSQKKLQFQFPSFFFNDVFPPVIPVISTPAVTVFYKKNTLYPTWAPIDPLQLTLAENPHVDAFQGQKPDKIWDRKRQQYTYPFFVIDPVQLTRPETTQVDKWTGYQPLFFAKSKQQQYLYTTLVAPVVPAAGQRGYRYMPYRAHRFMR